jgi:hypothetical protein
MALPKTASDIITKFLYEKQRKKDEMTRRNVRNHQGYAACGELQDVA